MTKEQRSVTITSVKMVIENSQTDAVELLQLLEITVEDLIKTFPHRLIEHAEKFGIYQETEEQETLPKD